MLLLAPVTLALWDLVAGLLLVRVGVLLLSGVALPPLSFLAPARIRFSLPGGGIPAALSICSMLELPGAHIDADLVFLLRLCWFCSDIIIIVAFQNANASEASFLREKGPLVYLFKASWTREASQSRSQLGYQQEHLYD